jgi:phage terminase large subunit-like protein
MASQSVAERIAALPVEQRRAALKQFSDKELSELLHDWRGFLARPDQIEPEGDWSIWLILAGRGWGKTRTGAEWIKARVESGKAKRIALVAETAADARDVMVEGESGILAIYPQGRKPLYEPSKRRVTWPNGAVATLYNATEPDQLRGPQHDTAWCDELAKWRYARETWDQLQFGMRLGETPQQIVTTTPRPIELIKSIVGGREGKVVVSRGATMDNKSNLAAPFLEKIRAKYEGTRLGRQELNGEVLGDMPGALWQLGAIDLYRIKESDLPDLQRIVVAVDPAVTSTDDSDDHGIIVAGTADNRGFVIEDASTRGSPVDWARRAISMYDKYRADAIVVEVNQGGDMVRHTLNSVRAGLPIIEVRASRGKHVRAEPISSLYEQGRVSHVGTFSELEDQMCLMTADGYRGEGSPDRCFAAGTMVETDGGPKPIEEVQQGDRVWTRRGLRPVLASSLTDPNAKVYDVQFSDGSSLTGTGNHPVFVEGRGFTRLDALVWGDTVNHLWSNEEWAERQSHSRARNTFDTRIAGASQPVATSTAGAEDGLIKRLCTAMFGKMQTAQSLMAGTSITSTAIPATTTLPIWLRSRLRIMLLSTSLNTATSSRPPERATWIGFEGQRAVGIAAKKVEGFIRALVPSLGKFAHQSGALALSAGLNMITSHTATAIGFVRGSASAGTTNGRGGTTRIEAASSAEPRSTSRKASRKPCAPVSVVGLSERAERVPVFNLTVEGENEYYANGILVHNCDALVWAFTELFPTMIEPKYEDKSEFIPSFRAAGGWMA